MNVNTRAQSEQTLHESAGMMEGILRSVMDAVITIDDAQRIVLFNNAAERMFGCLAHEATGESIERFIPQCFQVEHSEHIRSFAESGVTHCAFDAGCRLWGLRATGEEFPIEVSISQAEAGGKKFVALAIRDLTERRRTEESISEGEERFRLASQAARMYAYEWNVATDELVRSPEYVGILGVTEPMRFTRSQFLAKIHPDDRARFGAAIAGLSPENPTGDVTYRVLLPGGAMVWLKNSARAFFDPEGKMQRVIGMVVDVTEQKLAEEKLREYEKAAEGAEEMIAVVDREYRYLIANRKFLHARKMAREQVEGRLANEVLNQGVFEAVVKERLDECFQGKVVRFEMKYAYPELGERDVLISYFPIEGATGIDRVACIVQDITDRKRVENALAGVQQRLIEAQEQERSRIARELHDDIGQRLALVKATLDQAQQDLAGMPPEARIWVSELQKQLTEIATDVQALSHELHSSALEHLGLIGGLRSWCREFGGRQGMEIAFRNHGMASSPPRAISLCLFRVLQEAVRNAARHSGARRIEVQLRSESGEIQLVISDLGRGFNVEAAMRGQGLGLTSMRERVRLVNGTIRIQSKPMGGTTIHVRIPVQLEYALQQAAGYSGH